MKGGTNPLDENSVIINFGVNGNSFEFVRDGWSGSESHGRWAVGSDSYLSIPSGAITGPLLITITVAPYAPPGVTQELSIQYGNYNGRPLRLEEGVRTYGLVVPEDAYTPGTSNQVRLHHPHCTSPCQHGGADTRILAMFVHTLKIEPAPFDLYSEPVVLQPSVTTLDLQNLATLFQSLGQNCEFGLFQRRCGVEPHGLLRFSSITASALTDGIVTGFDSISSPDRINFNSKGIGSELIGHHDVYGLDYHTFKTDGEHEINRLKKSEAMRLGYLARMLLEQIDHAEKIFVVQRRDPSLSLSEVLPILAALRSRNSEVKLLWVVAAAINEVDKIGLVTKLGEGFYRGVIDKLAPGENAHDLSFDLWVTICSQVATDL